MKLNYFSVINYDCTNIFVLKNQLHLVVKIQRRIQMMAAKIGLCQE